ncbi:efflux RND transporter periplasmic adaptor subunit [Desulforegula conservatrix]|uniref:efflux RND transporter periplasmic adaptor subunit n=1 Tax=Desulforegula conservatrix TaxID=153026 RepID=UPI0003F7714D|nr:efflux RND transporter periplasmic adaptor subunit [Desulforegula conservatrix]
MKKLVIIFFCGLVFCHSVVFCAERTDQDNSPSVFSGAESSAVRALVLPRSKTILSGELAATIQKISVDMGQPFSEGQELLCLDCSVYNALLAKAKIAYEEAGKTVSINQKLSKMSTLSEIEIVSAESKLGMTKADLEYSTIQVKKCSLKAPFNGKVVKRLVDPYEYVTPGKPLIEIIDDTKVELQTFIPSKWIKWIKTGTTFSVSIDETGNKYNAKVKSIGARIDSVSQTIEIKADIENPSKDLIPGMTGVCNFNTK